MSDERQWDDWLDAIERTGLNLTTWEEEFVETMKDRREAGRQLSDRQAEILERIYSSHPAPNDGRRHRGTGQTPGLPDLMAFLPLQAGGFQLLVVECKAAGGRLRREQQLFRHQCVGAGVAHVTGDLDAVIEWLLAEKYLAPTQVPHYRLPKGLQA